MDFAEPLRDVPDVEPLDFDELPDFAPSDFVPPDLLRLEDDPDVEPLDLAFDVELPDFDDFVVFVDLPAVDFVPVGFVPVDFDAVDFGVERLEEPPFEEPFSDESDSSSVSPELRDVFREPSESSSPPAPRASFAADTLACNADIRSVTSVSALAAGAGVVSLPSTFDSMSCSRASR